jgi:DNA-binding transcriptional MocR family regulator
LLPPDWFDNDAMKRVARFAVRTAGSALTQYGSPEGLRPLRDLLALKLIDLGISAQADQVVLTNGATHALDLVIRTVLERGNGVVIEDPGYYPLSSYLRAEGIPVFAVGRGNDGIDLVALEKVLAQGRAKLVILNSILQNPTGTTLAPIDAHRLVALAEKYQIHIVEDDVYGDFHKGPTFRIANLDQLNRVIYISGFSKTLSADLRCGFIAAHKKVSGAIVERKELCGFLTSSLSERIVTEFLASGDYRRQIERFREKLTVKRAKLVEGLRALEFEVPLEPAGGFFVWARMRAGRSADKLAQVALGNGLVLAPGSIFSPELAPSSWLRFNVAHCDTVEFERRLKVSLTQAGP